MQYLNIIADFSPTVKALGLIGVTMLVLSLYVGSLLKSHKPAKVFRDGALE